MLNPICVDPFRLHPNQVRDNVQVHHIIPIVVRPDLAFREDNCMSLCPECHAKAEKESDA